MDNQTHDEKIASKRAKREASTLRGIKTRYFLGGAVLAAIAVPIVMFSADMVVTSSNAERMAREGKNLGFETALVPLCVTKFKQNAEYEKNVATLNQTSYWKYAEFINDGGWSDTIAGEGNDSSVNRECAKKILEDFKAENKAGSDKAAAK